MSRKGTPVVALGGELALFTPQVIAGSTHCSNVL